MDAVIQIAEIEAKVDDLREDFQRKALPVDMADAYPPDIDAAAYYARPFIRQLQLVGVGGRRLDFAKRDYYRAFEQRSRWTREKLLFDGEISTYDRRLHEEWEVRYEAMGNWPERPTRASSLRRGGSSTGVIIDIDRLSDWPSWVDEHATARFEMKERSIPDHKLPPLPKGVRPEDPDGNDHCRRSLMPGGRLERR